MLRILSLLAFALSAIAAPPVLTVAPASPKPGDAVVVTSSVAVTFDVRGSAEVTRHGTKSVVFTFTGPTMILAAAGKTAAPADTAAVLVGSGNPSPTPVPPGPSDEVKKLAADLVAAVKLDPPAQKSLLPALAKVWKESGTAVDAAKTWGDLEEEMRKRFTAAGTAGNLTNVQKTVANYLLSKIPGLEQTASEKILDADGKALAKSTFGSVAAALAQVK